MTRPPSLKAVSYTHLGSLHVEQNGAAHGGKGHGKNQLKQGLTGHGRVHGADEFKSPRSAGQEQAGISLSLIHI